MVDNHTQYARLLFSGLAFYGNTDKNNNKTLLAVCDDRVLLLLSGVYSI